MVLGFNDLLSAGRLNAQKIVQCTLRLVVSECKRGHEVATTREEEVKVALLLKKDIEVLRSCSSSSKVNGQ